MLSIHQSVSGSLKACRFDVLQALNMAGGHLLNIDKVCVSLFSQPFPCSQHAMRISKLSVFQSYGGKNSIQHCVPGQSSDSPTTRNIFTYHAEPLLRRQARSGPNTVSSTGFLEQLQSTGATISRLSIFVLTMLEPPISYGALSLDIKMQTLSQRKGKTIFSETGVVSIL